jgi:hypothetical protein
MNKGSGGSKLMNKQLILVVLVAFALIVHTPPGVSMVIAFVLLMATVFAVYHNGVQVIDAIVFFVLGVFLTQTYLGTGAQNAVQTVSHWFAQALG